jgi:AAA+ ATPase superfamily predicted ATPase
VDFVDRREELARLGRAFEAGGSGLVVVWGRRRVGKTTLLGAWVKATGGVLFAADESAPAVQRRYLAETIAAKLAGFADVEYPDWGALFGRLLRDAKSARWRGPLVLDELPYLVAASPELPSVLQRIVDHDAKEARFVLGVAGSSQSMMQGLVLDRSAPLFGRAREVLKLSPLSVHYLGPALGVREPRAIVEAWCTWGGIPRYWELAEPFGADLPAALTELVLSPRGALHDEPARLLLEESAMALRPFLDVIGGGAHRPSEIAARVGQPATSLSRPLARLTELELVGREVPFGEPERSGKRALYKISDPFLRLWFAIVAAKRSTLRVMTDRSRLALAQKHLPALFAQGWEELCRAAVPQLDLDEPVGLASRFWRGDGPEWDVVAMGLERKTLLLGEAKWLAREPTANELASLAKALVAKGVPPGISATRVVHALFVPSAPKGTRGLDGVRIVDAKDVIAALR